METLLLQMDKLRILVLWNGHRFSLADLYLRNFAFGVQKYLSTEFHKTWLEMNVEGRSFDIDMSPECESVMVQCYQTKRGGFPSRNIGPAAFPRQFLETYLNKTLIYEHNPETKIQLHVVDSDKDMVMLSYSFGTLTTILRGALADMQKEEMQPELFKAVGNQLMKMFQVNEQDLLNSGYDIGRG